MAEWCELDELPQKQNVTRHPLNRHDEVSSEVDVSWVWILAHNFDHSLVLFDATGHCNDLRVVHNVRLCCHEVDGERQKSICQLSAICCAFSHQITEKFYEKAYSFTGQGLARVANSNAGNWSFGFIDRDGKEVIELKYAAAMDFQNGAAAVSNGKKWGFINKDGTELSGMLWTDVGDFTADGIARVESDNVCGFVKLK